MDEFKINNDLTKAINGMKSIQNTMAGFERLKNIFNNLNNLQKITESFQKTSYILDNIQKELAERNIDIKVFQNVPMSEMLKLYSIPDKSGLSFADLVEDSLKLFGCVSYEKIVIYLELLNSRKKQLIKNEAASVGSENDFSEDIKCFEEWISAYILVKLEDYEKGDVELKAPEKKLLSKLKENKFLSNKELAQSLGYSERGIEELCAKIRRSFEMDLIEEKTAKRQALVELAKYIEL